MDYVTVAKNSYSREKALKDIGENKKAAKEGIQALRVQLASQPGLSCPTDDTSLLRHLRAAKFDRSKAFEQILHFYKMKARHGEYFKDFTPSSVRHIFDHGIMTVLPEADIKGRTVMVWSPGNYLPDEHTFPSTDLDKASFLQMDHISQCERTQLCGITAIFNYQGLTWKHFQNFTPVYAQKVMPIYMHSFPIRPKAMHLVLPPQGLAPIINLIKSFMSKKMQQRIFIHSTLDSLHKEISADSLPLELGGTHGTMKDIAKEWYKELESKEKQFVDRSRYFYQESVAVRTKDGAIDSQILGTAGTFSKLNID